MSKIVGLKEFRENVAEIEKKVKRGHSFVVVRRSRPIFKVSQPDQDELWETVIDFSEIRKEGVPAKELLKYLRDGKDKKGSKKARA